jgi:hypothetical protein
MNKKLILIFICSFVMTSIISINAADIDDKRIEYTISLLIPNSDVMVYTFKAKPEEMDILINAAKSASKRIIKQSMEKEEKDVLGDSFIRIEDQEGNEVYFSPLYRGYRLIETLINSLKNEYDKLLKEKKLSLIRN